jgi:hypothetical protein
VTRPRLAFLQGLAADLRRSVRRRAARPPDDKATPEAQASAAELSRRLDETRDRLRRDIPPPD